MRNSRATKKYVYSLIILTFFSFVAVSLINFAVDPLNVFQVINIEGFNKNRVCETKQERISKIPKMKKEKNKVDELIVGSSQVAWSVDKEYIDFLSSSKNTIALGTLNSAILQENIITAKNTKFLNSELKKVFLGIDFHSFGQPVHFENEAYKLISTKNLTFEEVKPLMFSFKLLEFSLTTVSQNMKKKKSSPSIAVQNKTDKVFNKQYSAAGGEVFDKFKEIGRSFYREMYLNYDLNNENFSDLSKFLEYAKDNKFEVVCFVTPSHIFDIVNIYESGKWEDYKTFKRKLASHCSYYDFSLINEYNTEEISPQMKYFRDPVHGSGYIGKMMIDRLFGISDEFGILVNSQNVEELILRDEENLKNYLQLHPDFKNKVLEWRK